MPPAQLVPNQPLTATPNANTAQGVAQPTPISQPAPPQMPIPSSPGPGATPQAANTPQVNTNLPAALSQISNYYQIPGQTAANVAAGGTAAGVASGQFEYQKGQAAIKQQQLQDSLDPSKYNITKNADGSLKILNPLGQQVSVSTYANLTSQDPMKVLQENDATDQASQQFVQAATNFQTFIQDKIATSQGDTQAQSELDDFYKANPGLDGLELGQIQKAFMNQYGSYYGQQYQTGLNPNELGNIQNTTPTITSANNPISTSPYENLAYYGAQNTSNPYAQSSANTAGESLQQQLQALANIPQPGS